MKHSHLWETTRQTTTAVQTVRQWGRKMWSREHQTGRWTSQAEWSIFKDVGFIFRITKSASSRNQWFQTSLVWIGNHKWANQESERQTKKKKKKCYILKIYLYMPKWWSLKRFLYKGRQSQYFITQWPYYISISFICISQTGMKVRSLNCYLTLSFKMQ